MNPIENPCDPPSSLTDTPENQQPILAPTPSSQTNNIEQTIKKRPWTIMTAWIVYIITALILLTLGIGSIIVTAIFSPYSWIVSYSWIPQIMLVSSFVEPFIIALAGFSLFYTYKKYPNRLKEIFILLSEVIIGLPIAWVTFNLTMPMIVYTAILTITALAPLIVLIIYKVRNKKRASSLNDAKKTNQKTTRTVYLVSIITLSIEFGIALISAIGSTASYVSMYLQDWQTQQQINQAAETNGLNNTGDLAKMVYTICNGEYGVVYKNADDTGLFECKKNEEIYSVTDPHKENTGHYLAASASYIGSIHDSTVAEYFPDTKYIYRSFGTMVDLILLVEANSEDEVIDDNIDAIYNYIKEISTGDAYISEIRVSVFYTEKLDTVKDAHDYILLAGAIGISNTLPHGNGFGDYVFEIDDTPALVELGENPSLYSSQTRDAIKFHRHISATIKNGKTLTIEKLREILEGSFEEGL